ncbi:MAG: chromosomal replication initiator protein DnaA [Actinobacteria bacterium]|nr:MAG: chromosomal replication initiator protein DnaA [Actinomycetota bacterium]
MTADEIWAEVLEVIRGELNEPSYKTWFEPTFPLELTDAGEFVIGVHNEFARSWLEDRYSQLVTSALRQVLGADVRARIIVDPRAGGDAEGSSDSAPIETPELVHTEAVVTEATSGSDFDPKYNFDTFVVGESNEFARNAALAVAEQPGLKYNPLFIWGGPGLGKTHLLQAIGNYVSENFPSKKVLFVTSEQFMNDFVNSINTKTQDSFRKKYRSVDVLLIDDIQFIENKLGIQEQFFHTFNELRQRGKAVVLASDRSPRDMNMEERYSSRLASGLPADIQPPSFETRLAILRQLTELQGIRFEDSALAFIAERSTPNIREMEGAVFRVIAYRELSKKEVVDLEMVEKVTRDIFPDRSHRPIPITSIQNEVCKYYGVSKSELISSKRSQAIVYPRQIAMYLAREITDLSLPKIGNEFGGRDHTTVMHAEAKIRKLMKSDREVYNQVQQLTSSIRQHA